MIARGGPSIATVVLAAGGSARMRGRHKLLETVRGRSLVEWAVRAALDLDAGPVVVVTGHRAGDVESAVPPPATCVWNEHWAEGLSTSLRVGLDALPGDVAASFVALADMPRVRPEHYRALVGAWEPGAIVVPTSGGRRGNPVLWSARYFDEMRGLSGDQGAKALMDARAGAVREVPVFDDAVLVDVDDPDQLERERSLA